MSENIAELSLELGRAINEMKSRLRQRIQKRVREYDPGLSFELLEIIGLLWQRDGINQQEIADRVSKDKSSMTYLINSLVKRQLVKRQEDAEDRRNKKIFLTDKGKQVRKTIFPWAMELYKKAAANISASELKKATALVKKMTDNLGE